MDIFTDIWNWLCNFLSECLIFIVDLLPDSPFKMIDNSVILPYLKWFNWFIPVDFMLTTLSLWLVAVSGYYILSVVLRLIKVID